MEPEEALHWHILRRKKDGVEDWIDRSVEKIGAVPTLNDVLLPAMKEVGDKFGAGELILPFVLQSAEVMKRAVAQLENYLDKIEGYTKGTVVLATVFGDVHDIGKSLVNTILTNNGYTVVDLGKQVPISNDPRRRAGARGRRRSASRALLVSTSKQMPLCVQELHERGLEYPVLIGGAAINRDFGRRIALPEGQGVRRGLRARRLLLQGRVRGPGRDGPAGRRGGARRAGRRRPATRRATLREKVEVPDDAPPVDRRLGALGRAHRRADPDAAVLGRARDRRSTSTRSTRYLDRHVLFKLHWGGRGVKGEAWRRSSRAMATTRLRAAPRAHVARAGLPAPARAARLLPGQRGRQRAHRVGPRGPASASSSASSSRASPSTTASAWPTSTARWTAASST